MGKYKPNKPGVVLCSPGEEKSVFISGVQGQHAVSTGVAYYYRGHYLYGTNFSPLVPVPFINNKGDPVITRHSDEAAPSYDRFEQNLLPESEIAALAKASAANYSYREEGFKQLRPTAQAFYPHDRGRYLAASAPGSRVHLHDSNYQGGTTNYVVSPSCLRAFVDNPDSTTDKQLNDPGVALPRSYSSHSAFRKPSLALSTDTDTLMMRDTPQRSSLLQDSEEDNGKNSTYRSIIGTGRPRKASVALNSEYNRNTPAKTVQQRYAHALGTTNDTGDDREDTTEDPEDPEDPAPIRLTKCTVHDDYCDGVHVANLHLTEQCKRGRGFKEQYPTITNTGRTMIDWELLLKEEKAKLSANTNTQA